jgi:hypothetical protein
VSKTISKIGGTCRNIQLLGGDVYGEFFLLNLMTSCSNTSNGKPSSADKRELVMASTQEHSESYSLLSHDHIRKTHRVNRNTAMGAYMRPP